ncbi:alpha/beta fold hydrolase [Streptomyces sp. NPDC000348]|uniref:alpha/beta fold hydrolase n=1 Tax=Streptomyces sp. NPDC000348 TaxID=3364538 RepID=UPI0036B30F52
MPAASLPALVAGGAPDVMIHAYAAYAMPQRLPDAEVALHSDAGHGFVFRRPEDFAREVNGFLDR